MRSEMLRSEAAAGVEVSKATDLDEGIGTYLLFGLGSRTYAIDVPSVREIVNMVDIQQVPNAPHDILGMIDLRDHSIPVVDLASRMQVASNPQDEARILVFEFGTVEAPTLVGIVADRVLAVREVESAMIERLDHVDSSWGGHSVLGVIRDGATQALVLKIEDYLRPKDLAGEFDFD